MDKLQNEQNLFVFFFFKKKLKKNRYCIFKRNIQSFRIYYIYYIIPCERLSILFETKRTFLDRLNEFDSPVAISLVIENQN